MFGALGWVINRQVETNRKTLVTLGDLRGEMQVLNTGASLGAREAIARLELRIAQLDSEQTALLERHNKLNESFAILAQRFNDNLWAARQAERRTP